MRDNVNHRHKELLERQHYGGPFWEKKNKPSSVEKEPFEYAPEEYPDEPIPEDLKKAFEEMPEYPEETFQSLKR
jgi:hypothetical protein